MTNSLILERVLRRILKESLDPERLADLINSSQIQDRLKNNVYPWLRSSEVAEQFILDNKTEWNNITTQFGFPTGILGEGVIGTAFSLPGNKVLKLQLSAGEGNRGPIFQAAREAGSSIAPFVPIIYGTGTFTGEDYKNAPEHEKGPPPADDISWVVMEKVSTLPVSAHRVFDKLIDAIQTGDKERIGTLAVAAESSLPSEADPGWLTSLTDAVQTLESSLHLPDLSAQNLGFRLGTGEIIFFDP